MSEAATFLRERFPQLFNRGVANLRKRAEDGSEGAQRRLADIEAARGIAWFRLEGAGDIYLTVDQGRCERVDERPADMPVRVAVALAAEEADSFLREAQRVADLDSDDAAYAAARSASGRVEQAIGDDPLELHLIVTETPDHERVVVQVGLNAPEPPGEPRFTATIAWDDLEKVRKGEVQPQQLMMGGRVRLAGDYSRAMQVAMTLMQQQAR